MRMTTAVIMTAAATTTTASTSRATDAVDDNVASALGPVVKAVNCLVMLPAALEAVREMVYSLSASSCVIVYLRVSLESSLSPAPQFKTKVSITPITVHDIAIESSSVHDIAIESSSISPSLSLSSLGAVV